MTRLQTTPQDQVYALAVTADASGAPLCFAARQSGLWQSADRDGRWRKVGPLANVPDDLSVTTIAFSPNFGADATLFAGVRGGVLRSSDGAQTWTVSALASPPPTVSGLVLSPNFEQDSVGFAATVDDGVFRSDDRGMTWRAWNIGLFDATTFCLAVSPAFAEDKRVFVGTETGLFYSKNGGRAWQETGFPVDHAPVLSLAVSPHFPQDRMLFAGTESAGLFRSGDGGQNWERILECEAIQALLLTPTFSDVAAMLAVTTHALWYSCDGGQHWLPRHLEDNLAVPITAAAAPAEITSESPVLLGLADGQVIWV